MASQKGLIIKASQKGLKRHHKKASSLRPKTASQKRSHQKVASCGLDDHGAGVILGPGIDLTNQLFRHKTKSLSLIRLLINKAFMRFDAQLSP
jgi:hypothetical protein